MNYFSTYGYTCSGCGCFVMDGWEHVCVGVYGLPFGTSTPPIMVTPQGWQCPNCKHIHAPAVLGCRYCNPPGPAGPA